MASRQILESTASELICLVPTTLDRVGKNEKFLETSIADAYRKDIDILGFENRRQGIYGPYLVLQQLSMKTPFGHTIYPDIVMLSASGHIVVVEVKLYANRELGKRDVIAQIIDYASSFPILTDADRIELFQNRYSATEWGELIETAFPDSEDTPELATVLRERMLAGEIQLIIACDKVPNSLPDAVAGISAQSALAFELDLVELTPYVRPVFDGDTLLLIPSVKLATKIVNRTAVTVTYRPGETEPKAQVTITPLEEIEKEIRKTRRDAANARLWMESDIEEECRKHESEVARMLFEYSRNESDGSFIEKSERVNPTFNFRIQSPNTKLCPIIYSYNPIDREKPPYLYLENVRRLSADPELEKRLIEKLNEIGLKIDSVPVSVTCMDFTTHRKRRSSSRLYAG